MYMGVCDLNKTQIVEATHLRLEGWYSATASSLADLNLSNVSTPRMVEELLLAHLVFKCLTRCVAWSYQKVKGQENPQIDQWVSKSTFFPIFELVTLTRVFQLQELFKNTVIQLQALAEKRILIVLSLQQSATSPDPIAVQSINYLTRHIFVFGKFYRRMLQLDAGRFVTLPMSTDLVFYYWSKVVQATGSPSGYIASKLKLNRD